GAREGRRKTGASAGSAGRERKTCAVARGSGMAGGGETSSVRWHASHSHEVHAKPLEIVVADRPAPASARKSVCVKGDTALNQSQHSRTESKCARLVAAFFMRFLRSGRRTAAGSRDPRGGARTG